MNMYNYPPLFTKQRNEQTWVAQKDLWQKIILENCRNENIWRLNSSSAIFDNKSIDRTLHPEVATQILDYVASNARGEWTTKQKQEFLVFWQSPVEIAQILRMWANDTGRKNTVLTLYELQEGDTIPQLKDYDEEVLTRTILELQKRGDATAMKEDGKVVGLKLN